MSSAYKAKAGLEKCQCEKKPHVINMFESITFLSLTDRYMERLYFKINIPWYLQTDKYFQKECKEF